MTVSTPDDPRPRYLISYSAQQPKLWADIVAEQLRKGVDPLRLPAGVTVEQCSPEPVTKAKATKGAPVQDASPSVVPSLPLLAALATVLL